MSELKEGTKFDQSKLRYSLLSPKAIEGLVKILEFGATKYEPYNWAKGITYSRVFSAMQRHLWAWWDGEENDPETGLNHMFHAMCNTMFLSHFVSHPLTYKDFDDRPNTKKEPNCEHTTKNGSYTYEGNLQVYRVICSTCQTILEEKKFPIPQNHMPPLDMDRANNIIHIREIKSE